MSMLVTRPFQEKLYLNSDIKPLSVQQNHVDQLVTLANLKRSNDGILNQQFGHLCE